MRYDMPGEEIGYDEEAVKEYHASGGANPSDGGDESFPEEDERESRKMAAQLRNVY